MEAELNCCIVRIHRMGGVWLHCEAEQQEKGGGHGAGALVKSGPWRQEFVTQEKLERPILTAFLGNTLREARTDPPGGGPCRAAGVSGARAQGTMP